MSSIIKKINRICDFIIRKNKGDFNFSSPIANAFKSEMRLLKNDLMALNIFPNDWTGEISIGKGNLAKVVWIAFLPPKQKVSDGIYVVLCFGTQGNGFVAGTAISMSSRKKYKAVKTTARKNPAIDVDGTRKEARYNNAFINPLDVYAENVDEEELIAHLKESANVCLKNLNILPSIEEPQETKNEDNLKEEGEFFMTDFTPRSWDEVKPELSSWVELFYKATEAAGLTYDFSFVKRFVAALLAKPFVILTGLSGSGKTKLAQAFSSWLAKDNTLVVPVGADWVNNEHLLGYPNALTASEYVMPSTGVLDFILRAKESPAAPFFLILDEMNLSHVERYFSDFLSAMESGDTIKLYDGNPRSADDVEIPTELSIPKNLFVIGTMNVDETTYMFSPKVLDRAQVLEFRVSVQEMANYLSNSKDLDMESLENGGSEHVESFMSAAANDSVEALEKTLKDSVAGALNQFFPELAKIGAEFGYRTAREVLLFSMFYDAIGEGDPNAIIDAAVLQKLLPKLHGSQMRLSPILKEIHTLATNYPKTKEKVERMQIRLESNGFTSFAEA